MSGAALGPGPARRCALIGCGHIGGSLALALRAPGEHWVGFDPAAAEAAQARGIIDEVAGSVEAATAGAALCIVAAPVRSIPGILGRIAPDCALVTDVGSTKGAIVFAGERALGERFVGGHPMAGREVSGPAAADATLFQGKKVLLTRTELTDPLRYAEVAALWRRVGAEPVEMEPAMHDALCAAVSHLPHVAAYALTLALGGFGGAIGERLPGLFGGGFLDTTRIASSDPVMWRDIFLDNQLPVLTMVHELEKALARLRGLIEAEDDVGLERALGEARQARARILAG